MPNDKNTAGGGPHLSRQRRGRSLPAHLTAAFGKEAAAFVEREKGHPFYLQLTFNAVHNPLQPDAEHLARFEKISARATCPTLAC